jgi:putative ABC transport system permease protein
MTIPSPDGTGGVITAQAAPRLVSPGYFEALGLRVIAGRRLEESDTETSQPVAVVNESFARRYLGRAPLDARVPLGVWGAGQNQLASVVGVVEDLRYIGGNVTTTLPEMYFSYRQIRTGLRSSIATLLIRADRDPSAITGAVRTALRDADAAAVPGLVMTLEDRLLASSLARPRLYAVLLAIFAGVALTVTGVGLFGVLSYTVAQRTRELALRAALGARRLDLIALVVRQGLGVAAAGVVIGLAVAAGLARFMTTLLFGITAGDVVTYVAVPAVLLGTAAAACFLPARRAARLDPLRGLRS